MGQRGTWQSTCSRERVQTGWHQVHCPVSRSEIGLEMELQLLLQLTVRIDFPSERINIG